MIAQVPDRGPGMQGDEPQSTPMSGMGSAHAAPSVMAACLPVKGTAAPGIISASMQMVPGGAVLCM